MLKTGSGSLYILNDAEIPKKFGEVKDVEIVDPPIEWADDASDFVVPVTGMEATYETCCKISKDIVLALLGIRDSVLDLCLNKKVAHLARHGKNKKIRKKNFHRAIRILEENE